MINVLLLNICQKNVLLDKMWQPANVHNFFTTHLLKLIVNSDKKQTSKHFWLWRPCLDQNIAAIMYEH